MADRFYNPSSVFFYFKDIFAYFEKFLRLLREIGIYSFYARFKSIRIYP